MGEGTSNTPIATQADKEYKMFLNALKSLKKDHVDGLPTYHGSLNGEDLLDWIDALNSHFDLKEMDEDKRVSVAKARLKGATLTWWNVMQEERVQQRKKKINS